MPASCTPAQGRGRCSVGGGLSCCPRKTGAAHQVRPALGANQGVTSLVRPDLGVSGSTVKYSAAFAFVSIPLTEMERVWCLR